MKYVLNEERLEPLDIILTKDKNLISKGIRLVTQGDYSHALIYMSSFSAIEATRDGRVFSENIQRLIFDRLDECKVLRYKGKLTEEQRKRIDYYARSQVTTLYSIKEAIRVKVLGKKDVSAMESTQFCSRLVAQAYSSVGIDLTYNSDYCSPQDLNNSELLIEVKGVLRSVTEWDLNFASTPSPIKESQKQLYSWLDKVAVLAKNKNKNIQSQEDAEKFIRDFPEYDEEICNYILSTNYLTTYKLYEDAEPRRFAFDPEIKLDVVGEFELCCSNTERYLINFARNKSIYMATSLKYYKLMVDYFENILDQCLRHLDVIIQHALHKIDEEKDEFKKSMMSIYKSKMDVIATKIKNARVGNGYVEYIQPNL